MARAEHRKSVASGHRGFAAELRWVASAASAALLLAACSAAGSTAEQPVAGPAAGQTDSSSHSTDGSSEQDPEAALDAYAQSLGLTDPPEVELIRYISPDEEVAVLEQCMLELGFPMTDDGGFDSGGLSLEENEPLATALYTCAAQYPLDPVYLRPLTEAQIGMIYDWLKSDMIPCFDANGWPIDPQSLPSKTVYIATFYTSERWVQTNPPPDLTNEELYAIQMECPGQPPSEDLYGF